MTTKPKPKPKPGDVVAGHQAVYDQVHPCVCGRWYVSPVDLQAHPRRVYLGPD